MEKARIIADDGVLVVLTREAPIKTRPLPQGLILNIAEVDIDFRVAEGKVKLDKKHLNRMKKGGKRGHNRRKSRKRV